MRSLVGNLLWYKATTNAVILVVKVRPGPRR